MSHSIANNAEITFTGVIPEEAERKIAGLLDENTMWLKLSNDKAASVLEISEAWGDLRDNLNEIVTILQPFNISPKIGEYNRYYGDYDGFDVFTGTMFESMDDQDYGKWCGDQKFKAAMASAQAVVYYCVKHKDALPEELCNLVSIMSDAFSSTTG